MGQLHFGVRDRTTGGWPLFPACRAAGAGHVGDAAQYRAALNDAFGRHVFLLYDPQAARRMAAGVAAQISDMFSVARSAQWVSSFPNSALTSNCRPRARAASCASTGVRALSGSFGLVSTAISAALGTSSYSNPSALPAIKC